MAVNFKIEPAKDKGSMAAGETHKVAGEAFILYGDGYYSLDGNLWFHVGTVPLLIKPPMGWIWISQDSTGGWPIFVIPQSKHVTAIGGLIGAATNVIDGLGKDYNPFPA